MRLERDQAALKSLVDAETRVQRAFEDEGRAEKAHRDDDAASLLETSVMPAVDATITLARALGPETAWGRARRDEMLAAQTERKGELPRYVTALRDHDQEAQLASALKQADVEKRVLRASQAISDGPAADGGAR